MDATALLDSTGALLPHLTVLVTGLVILTLDLFLTPRSRYLNEVVGLIGLLVAFFFTLSTTGAPRQVFMGMAVVDYLGAFFNATFLLIAALTILLSASYVRREGVSAGEYYALVLFATTGFMFVAAAADLIMVFLAIETLSIATYILAGLLREDPRSQEAAFKYFMLGALSSAFFLYGIATIYGALGNTNLVNVAQALGQGNSSKLLLMGMALLIVGLGFKVAVVPFHMWVPDVYEGAPYCRDGLYDGWSQSGSLCRVLAGLFPGICHARDGPALGPALCLPGRVNHDPGQFCGHGAAESETHAGVFQYRARRLCLCGPGGAQCPGGQQYPLLPGGLHAHVARSLHGAHGGGQT